MRPKNDTSRFLRLPLAAAVAAGALLLSSCGSAQEAAQPAAEKTVSIVHAQGTADVPVNPARIAVLDFSLLDTVDALGGTVVGVPKQALPDFLDKYAAEEYADLGGMKEPDVEKLAGLNPDVILIGGRSASLYPEVSKIAPTLDLTLAEGDFVEAFADQSGKIGKLLDKEEQVDKAVTEVKSSVERVKGEAADSGNGLILMTSGGKVAAFGTGSRFGMVHDVLGVEPAVGDLTKDRHGQSVSFEFINKAKPEHLFVIDRDSAIGESGQAAAQVLDNDLVNDTPAVKDSKVTYLDGQRWYLLGSGLTNLPKMITEIENGL